MNEEKNPRLQVETPCHMAWKELSGESDRRWCNECSLHVVDGSAMTKAAAEQLVTESEDRVCMRLAQDSDGNVVHAEEAPPMGRALRIGLAAAAGVLSACGDDRNAAPGGTEVEPTVEHTIEVPPDETIERPREIMGEMCYEPPTDVVSDPTLPNDDSVEPSDALDEDTPSPTPKREVMGKIAPLSPRSTNDGH